MKKKLLNKISILALLACFCLQSPAQTGFRFRAELDTVGQPGFYQINLLPALTARLQPGMPDIRIVDTGGKQVPYILKSDIPAFSENRFKELPIISNKKEADKQTHIIVENNSGQSLSQLLLVIKNTDANRTVSLSGSDDNRNWYIIKENIPLNNFFTTEGDHFIQALVFPNSTYRYFKIIINGRNILPVNIVKAGIYEQSFINGKYQPLPRPGMLQTDSGDKSSYIFIRFNDNYFVDRIELQVNGPKFYKRNTFVWMGTSGDAHIVTQDTLQANTAAIFPVDKKGDHLLLQIKNDDNPPLQIVSVTAYQLNRYLYTYLEKGKQYALVFGDSAATAPVYDLQYFKDSIGNALLPLAYGKIVLNKPAVTEQPVTPKANKALLWVALGTVLVALVLLTAKMTREINKRNP